MSTNPLKSKVPVGNPTMRGTGWTRSPNFDASDIHSKYKSFSWTQEFPLEKLCITELGLRDISRKGAFIRTGYRDVACVPLPGVSTSEVTAGHPDKEYKKATKTYTKQKTITPYQIPSTPLLDGEKNRPKQVTQP
ncbi:MAG: hypothetical protein Q9184_006767 [Pyrenodesmia sp. 2 TL-2023]